MRKQPAIGLRMYRALASAFPFEFKNAYGDEMLQVAEDAIEPIWRQHGVLGLVRLLADIAIRLPIEHLAELRQDVRYGLRMLAASPGFTTVALLSLSLGNVGHVGTGNQQNQPHQHHGERRHQREVLRPGLHGFRRLTFRNVLVLSQVAGSLMLLLLTGFVVLGFQRTSGIEVGFDSANLYVMSLDPVRQGYSGARAADFLQKLLDRVQKLPSVTAACLTETVPMAVNGNPSVSFSRGLGSPKAIHSAHRFTVGRDYFDTLGIPILLGRGFRKEDEAAGSTAVIVTEKLVRVFWPGADPLGRRIEIADDQRPPSGLDSLGTFDHRFTAKGHQTFAVVGVVKDLKMLFAMEDPRPGVFFPLRAPDYDQPSLRGVTLMMRAAPGGDVTGAVRHEISAMDANLTPFEARSMEDQIDGFMYLVRLAMKIYGTIGLFGLILASVGLAGVTAYSVTRRSREIGIRIALGAARGDVLRVVMSEGIVLVAVGTVLGLAGACAAARMLSGLISAIATATSASTSDPVLLVGAPLLLAALALAACYLPARRSTRIDPVVALRLE